MNERPVPPVFRVHQLGYRPGGKEVLAGLSFTVESGEFLAIIGPNGAGKSTLLRHLNGILPVRTGRVELDGKPLGQYSNKAAARRMTYVPQAQGWIPPYPVLEFLLLARYPHLDPFQAPGREDRQRVREILRQFRMLDFEDRQLETLSGGERQKIYLAGAMVQESPVILLDEPTSFLDPHHCREIHSLLRHLHRQQRRTILMVTHDVNAALELATRVLGLRAGRLDFDLPAAGTTARQLDQLYGVTFHQYGCLTGQSSRAVFLPVEDQP